MSVNGNGKDVKDIVSVKEALRRASSSMSVLSDGRFLAEMIVRHVLGWNRTELFTRFDESITAEHWGQYGRAVEGDCKVCRFSICWENRSFMGCLLRWVLRC